MASKKRGRPITTTGSKAAISRARSIIHYHKHANKPVEWARRALVNAKLRAKHFGVTCDLTTEQLFALLQQSDYRCAITGESVRTHTGGCNAQPNSLSVARINRKGDFTEGNIVLVSYDVAHALARLDLDECVQLGEWAQQRIDAQEDARIADLLEQIRQLDAQADSAADALLAIIGRYDSQEANQDD